MADLDKVRTCVVASGGIDSIDSLLEQQYAAVEKQLIYETQGTLSQEMIIEVVDVFRQTVNSFKPELENIIVSGHRDTHIC